MTKSPSKYWQIVERLLAEYAIHPMEKHEALFLANIYKHVSPHDEDELTDAQKSWLLKMDKKYKTPEIEL